MVAKAPGNGPQREFDSMAPENTIQSRNHFYAQLEKKGTSQLNIRSPGAGGGGTGQRRPVNDGVYIPTMSTGLQARTAIYHP